MTLPGLIRRLKLVPRLDLINAKTPQKADKAEISHKVEERFVGV
jgi:hypothetical protein